MISTASLAIVESNEPSDIAVYAVAGVLGLILIILWIAAAISILRNDRLTGGGKVLWFVVIIAFPFLGCLGWFFFGRKAQLVKSDAVHA